MAANADMSESDLNEEYLSYPPLIPVSPRRTFETGAVPASAAASVKRTLSRIIQEKSHILRATYVYENLSARDEIRILRIIKGTRNQKIQCALLRYPFPPSGIHPFNSTVAVLEYNALSYWWGDDEADNQITINSYVQCRTGTRRHSLQGFEYHTFYVRPNLEAALRQIRSGEHDVDIWVDAICINQDNKKEKTAQVSRMHEIYNRAENVCVWLGAGVPKTKETFNFLNELLNLQKLDELITSDEMADKWELVFRLMANKWFSRRWVIQELTLAQNVIVLWGAEKMAWCDFADAIALFMTKHDEIKQILSRKLKHPAASDYFGDARALGANTLVKATNDLFRKSRDGRIQQKLLSLEVLVSCRFLAFESSDPRDIIYAVLSVAKDTSHHICGMTARTTWMTSSQHMSKRRISRTTASLIQYSVRATYKSLLQEPEPPRPVPLYDPRIAPDYDKSLIDVLADFMDYCIEQSKSLDILCRHWAPPPRKNSPHELLQCSGAYKEKAKLPSWIPSISGNAFGGPEDALNGRLNGDSFVGSPERENQHQYNASAGLLPCVRFGRYNAEEDKMKDFTHRSTRIRLPERLQRIIGTPPKQKLWPLSRKYDGTLYIKGFRLDQIIEISPRISSGMIPAKGLTMGGWPPDCDNRTVPDQLWRTLVADRGPYNTSARAWYHRACRECLMKVDDWGNLNTTKIRSCKGTPSTMVSFLDRVQCVTWNRCFFLAMAESDGRKGRKPRFGLAPPQARIGDWICILFGCSVPVLLREESGGPKSYFQFVGECYVHGYMDGEAVPTPKPKYPYDKATEFNLR